MAKSGGPGEKMTRPPRANNTPRDDDAQSELELEMDASGRHNLVPHEGLVGAHLTRVAPTSAAAGDGGDEDQLQDPSPEGEEPAYPGSDVAPTKLAEERERERHRLERALGRTPAGEDGQIRDQRTANVTRQALDQAAREADRKVVGHELPKKD
jgi:hypothetical protein